MDSIIGDFLSFGVAYVLGSLGQVVLLLAGAALFGVVVALLGTRAAPRGVHPVVEGVATFIGFLIVFYVLPVLILHGVSKLAG